MTSSEKHLEEFLSYLDQSLVRISNLCNSNHDGQCRSFKKTLLFSFIDNLSTLVYPSKKSSVEGVRKLVTQYGRWHEASLVSTPHLCRWIETQPEGLTPKGKELAISNLDEWEHGCIVPISRDIPIATLKRHVRPGADKAGSAIERLTHFSLLWNQRHHLIHKFMPIGVNLEFPDDVRPYYISLSYLTAIVGANESDSFWQLIYPTGFLLNLARTCLEGVSPVLKERLIDVSKHYWVGHYLLEDLNQWP
jgi:hypothetical protein